ncbi:MAG: LytR family transcriptional regulator [Ruminococcaceae bacterium]|nr:LytR family transcriptional regulator [Oscillospiraceae bacterium]
MRKRVLSFVLLSVVVFSFLGASLVRGALAATDTPRETEAARGGVCTLLLLGKDNAAALCDVIMLASFDLNENTLHIVQIPRDTYFAYTDADYKKINAAPRVLGGADKLADALSSALGVRIDGYMEFSLDFVKAAVDRIGGVEIFVPCDMDYDDPAQNLSIHLKKGQQTLMGDEAVSFVRFRSGYARADLGRMDAQKLFLAAFAKAFGERVSLSELPGMLLLAMRYLKTNLRFDTMLSLATGARRIPSEHITAFTLPGEEVQSEYSGAWYYILSREGCAEAIGQYLKGAEPMGFDTKGLFTDVSRKDFHAIYQKKITALPYTFDSLASEGLPIE